MPVHSRAAGSVLPVVLLLVVGLAATPLAPAHAAPAPLRVATVKPMVGEPTVLAGSAAPARRPVTLQVLRDGAWRSVYGKRTARAGAYTFSVGATSTSTAYRVVAPRAKVAGKTRAAVVSQTVRVVGTPGRGVVDVLPAPVGQRGDTAGAFPGRATFVPARPGRPVHVYRLVDGQWSWVVSATQDRAGVAAFNVPGAQLRGATTLRAVTVPAGRAARVATPARTVTPTTPTFSDDFSGTRLDPARWGLRAQPYTGRRLCARPAADRVKVGDGVATLSVRKIASSRWESGRRVCTQYGVWDNAMIGTASSTSAFQQERGVFAARIAMQRATGMHGAFWLQGPGVTGAEIDVIEHFGSASKDGLMTKVHHTTASGATESATTGRLDGRLGSRSATQWNVYSVEWTPTRYVFRINGVVTWVTSKPHMSTAQQEIVLSLLTSDWNLPNLKDPSSTMKVDWVRAWS